MPGSSIDASPSLSNAAPGQKPVNGYAVKEEGAREGRWSSDEPETTLL